jgi:hypothetical protein
MESGVAHPLVDARIGEWVVSITDSARVGLTAGRAGLLADAARAGRRVAVIAPPGARVTLPLLAALRTSGGEWFSRGAAETLWSPGYGVTLAGQHELPAIAHRRPDRPPLRLDDPMPDGVVPAVQVTVTVRLSAERETRLGRAAEILAAGLSGSPLDTWGPGEPAVRTWDRDALTEFARSFAPRDVFLVLSGGSGHPVAGFLRVARTGAGLIEQTTMLAAVDADARGESIAAALRETIQELQPIGGVAYQHVATHDAAVPPIFVAPPRPLAVVLGARAAHRAESVVDRLASITRVERIGSRKHPGALVTWPRLDRADLSDARRMLDDAALERLAIVGEGGLRAS